MEAYIVYGIQGMPNRTVLLKTLKKFVMHIQKPHEINYVTHHYHKKNYQYRNNNGKDDICMNVAKFMQKILYTIHTCTCIHNQQRRAHKCF